MENFIFCAVWNTQGNLINITIYCIMLGKFYLATFCSAMVLNTANDFETILLDMRPKFHLLFKDCLLNFHNRLVEENSLPPAHRKKN